MYFILFLVAINVFKLAVTRYFPLIGDEGYYWLWGQHLDLSYVDHPPMIAYVNFLLTTLFGNSETAVRLTAILIVLLISWIVYLTGKELYGQRTGVLAAVIFNLLPTFFGGGLFLVPQTILFLFWSLSFYLLTQIIKNGKAQYWYLLGISVGLGLLSDYVMGLFVVGTALFILFNRERRWWLTKKEPYLAALIAAAIFSPVVIWNLRHGFTPFFYWGGKIGATPRIADNLLNFVGLQMVLYTPVIFWETAKFIRRFPNSLLSVFSTIVFLPFALISPLVNIGGHWTSTAYLPAILDAPQRKRWVIGITIFSALLVNALGFAYYLSLYPTPAELKGKEFTINRELPAFLKQSTPKTGRTFYLANNLGVLGLVSFHGKVKTRMVPGRLKQVDLWGKLEIQKGDNVIYFTLNESELYHKLKPLFKKVRIEPQKRLFNKDADLPSKLQVLHCEDFQGGFLP